jgi:hypothetical protein
MVPAHERGCHKLALGFCFGAFGGQCECATSAKSQLVTGRAAFEQGRGRGSEPYSINVCAATQSSATMDAMPVWEEKADKPSKPALQAG